MTLILGKVCEDGVVIVGDSKATYSNKPPTYDNQKIFDLGTVAIGLAGTNIPMLTALAIAGTAQMLVRHKRGITAPQMAEELLITSRVFLETSETEIGILVIDGKGLYVVDVRKGEIKSGDAAALGEVEHLKLPPPIKAKTIDKWVEYLKKTLDLNKGETVGGEPQIAIIKV